MNNPQKLQGRVVLVVMTVGLIALASSLIVLLNVRSKDQAAQEQLRATVRELRVQLDDKDRTISDLKASADRLQATVTATPSGQTESRADASLNAISELGRRIAEIGSVQTQTLALVRSIATKTEGSQSPERAAKERRAALAVLEEARAEQEVKLAVASKKVEELLVTLRVPNDVSSMPTDRALSVPSAKAYWPYFEARREQEMLQLVSERLKLRLIQEQLDSRVQEKANGP